MKKNYLYAFMAFGLMMASCSNDLPENPINNNDAIKIMANVAPMTRMPQLNNDGSGNFTTGDILSLFVTDNKNQNIINKNYAYNSDVLTWSGFGLQENTTQVTFAGCYPQQTTVQNGTFEFNTLTAQDKDLLLSPAQTVTVGTSAPINLTFNHALHKLDFTFTAGNGYTENDITSLSLTCKAQTTCIVNAAKGIIESIKNTTENYTSTGQTASFYLVPQATENIVLTININGENKTITLNSLLNQLNKPQTELTGGKRCSLTLKIGRDGITVEGGSIGAWEDQVTADGEIIID